MHALQYDHPWFPRDPVVDGQTFTRVNARVFWLNADDSSVNLLMIFAANELFLRRDWEKTRMDDELQLALLDILEKGILAARMAAWSNRADESAIETDHIHTIPDLLRKPFRIELLKFYWEQRGSYIAQRQLGLVTDLDKSWATIRRYLDAHERAKVL